MRVRVVLFLAAGAAARMAGAQATVTGSVFDSLRTSAPMHGATVVLQELARYVSTDARGRYQFDSVPAGRYSITFMHPSLDSLDMAAESRAIEVPARGSVTQRLATPSARTIYSRLCAAGHDAAGSLVIGRVHDADDSLPIAGAVITAGWMEYVLDGGRMRGSKVRANAVTNAAGVYLLCGLPADVPVEVHVLANGFGAGPIPMDPDPLLLSRLNIALSRRDTAARLTPEELVDTARQVAPLGSGRGSATLAGTIRTSDGRRISAAFATILGTADTVRVDSAGAFRFVRVPAGTRTLEVRAVGLSPVSARVDLQAGHRLDTTITLERRAQALSAVAVEGERPRLVDRTGFAERMKMGVGRFITAADIEKRPSTQIINILERVSSMHLMCPQGVCTLYMRGGLGMANKANLCVPTYFIDGIKASQGDAQSWIQTPDIKGIEVYTQGQTIPPQYDYSSRTGCGSVIVWTK